METGAQHAVLTLVAISIISCDPVTVQPPADSSTPGALHPDSDSRSPCVWVLGMDPKGSVYITRSCGTTGNWTGGFFAVELS